MNKDSMCDKTKYCFYRVCTIAYLIVPCTLLRSEGRGEAAMRRVTLRGR